MVRIARGLEQVKRDLPGLLEQHVHAALAAERGWVFRVRLLCPLTTLLLLVTQVLHGNTAITHLRHLWVQPFTAAAYCKARGRLPLALLRRVSRSIARQLVDEGERESRWRGHRVWWADGSSFSMPDTPGLQEHFGQHGQQKQGCGFPTATLLVLCSAAGFITQTLALPLRTHEASRLRNLHGALAPGDGLIYDRPRIRPAARSPIWPCF